MSDSVSIAVLLSELGYDLPEAQVAARSVLISAGLTNAAKTNISALKRNTALDVLNRELVPWCGDFRCARELDPTGRRLIRAAAASCAACGGRSVVRALNEMASALVTRGIHSLVVVGGSPSAQQEIRDGLRGSRLAVRLISGTSKLSSAHTKGIARRADLVVLWIPTAMCHAISTNFARATDRSRLIYVNKRGVGSLADQVATWLVKGAA